MSNQNGDHGDSVDYSQLNLYAGPEMVDLSNMTIYEKDTVEFLGTVLQACIIGSSHFINAPELGYREVTSCRPIEMQCEVFNPVTMNYDITDMSDVRLYRQAHGHDVSIDVVAFVDGFSPEYVRGMDIAYTFGDEETGAPTGIDFKDDGWETVHAYPEFNIDLYTRTRFDPR